LRTRGIFDFLKIKIKKNKKNSVKLKNNSGKIKKYRKNLKIMEKLIKMI